MKYCKKIYKVTLMHVNKENGSVTISSRPANSVRIKAQKPGPSGSAEKKPKKMSYQVFVTQGFFWFFYVNP
jgi:hypothetical protein